LLKFADRSEAAQDIKIPEGMKASMLCAGVRSTPTAKSRSALVVREKYERSPGDQQDEQVLLVGARNELWSAAKRRCDCRKTSFGRGESSLGYVNPTFGSGDAGVWIDDRRYRWAI
jgi:hypothetical protein